MRLSRLRIENFRNFKLLDVALSDSVVVLGENKVGKSNLLYALRLVLDPSLPDSARQLRREDLWDGVREGPTGMERILVSVDVADFEDESRHLALLAEHLVQAEPMVARLTYVWQPVAGLKDVPSKDSDYEFFVFGGDRPENRIGYEVRRRLPMDVLPALRDAESDLGRWAKSPLRPLLDVAAGQIDEDDLDTVAKEVDAATSRVTELEQVKALAATINDKLKDMVGDSQAIETLLRYAPADPDKLIRALRLYIDGGKRPIADASLGSANVLYLALKLLEYEQLVEDAARDHTFLAIEEPEAHLHPVLQRLVFRNYLRPRTEPAAESEDQEAENSLPGSTTVLVTTHSPHIASVSPLRSFLVLRESGEEGSVGRSLAEIKLDPTSEADLERYLDVSRAEMLFARAVILVEGDAERFLVPVLAREIGVDLDEHGVVVCSVGGTHFEPFISLVGARGLALRFALLTDLDPTQKGNLGESRVVNGIMRRLLKRAVWKALDFVQILKRAPANGVFLNADTFELELARAGYGVEMAEALTELLPKSRNAKTLLEDAKKGKSPDGSKLMALVERVGKGRFAQRLAGKIPESDGTCPEYVEKAIKHVL